MKTDDRPEFWGPGSPEMVRKGYPEVNLSEWLIPSYYPKSNVKDLKALIKAVIEVSNMFSTRCSCREAHCWRECPHWFPNRIHLNFRMKLRNRLRNGIKRFPFPNPPVIRWRNTQKVLNVPIYLLTNLFHVQNTTSILEPYKICSRAKAWKTINPHSVSVS